MIQYEIIGVSSVTVVVFSVDRVIVLIFFHQSYAYNVCQVLYRFTYFILLSTKHETVNTIAYVND